MKFSLNFIKEFFDPKCDIKEVANSLTMVGLEVEHIEECGKDFVCDVEITSNRYDWLSMFGIAREIASSFSKSIDSNFPKLENLASLKDLEIKVEDKNDCPLYVARAIKNCQVGQAPEHIKEKIINCGINSVNSVVDITNYCMLKWGNPLHAFDLDKIEGNIYVRRAKRGEEFLGLDGKQRSLTKENLVIADDKKVIALAGVIGAKNTEVDFSTKNILLEAAIFSGSVIRKSRQLVNINTESSYRFERSVSIPLLEVASSEAATLICKDSGSQVLGYKLLGDLKEPTPKPIKISLEHLKKYIGAQIPQKDIERILKNLGLEVKIIDKENLEVTPSVFRLDIKREVDVYEEITRIYGFANIQEELPLLKPQAIKDNNYALRRKLKSFLVNLGLKEVITYSLTSEENLKLLGQDPGIGLTNPLRSQENTLRTTLLSGMLYVIKHNLNQKNQNLSFFEMANIYQQNINSFKESAAISLALTQESGGVLRLKGMIIEIMKFFGLESCEFNESKYPVFFNCLNITLDKKPLGFVGKLNSSINEKCDIRQDVYFAQIDLETLLTLSKNQSYKNFSRYPLISRDISMSLEEDARFIDVETLLKEKAEQYLIDYLVVDTYQDMSSQPIREFFTLRIFYGSKEGTLTSLEVDKTHNSLRETLANKKNIILR